MALLELLTKDLTASMKARDAERTSVLRMAKSAIKNREIEKKAPLDDTEIARVLQALVKQREEASEQFSKAGRSELADKEQREIVVLKAYLPSEATDAEIEAAVRDAIEATGASSPKDLGQVMKAALGALGTSGRLVDGKKVSAEARSRLGG